MPDEGTNQRREWPDELSNLMFELAQLSYYVKEHPDFADTEWNEYQSRLKKLLSKANQIAEEFGFGGLTVEGKLDWPPKINMSFLVEL
jgi:hypothetical protein